MLASDSRTAASTISFCVLIDCCFNRAFCDFERVYATKDPPTVKNKIAEENKKNRDFIFQGVGVP